MTLPSPVSGAAESSLLQQLTNPASFLRGEGPGETEV
jgi:hypothetical protein